MLLDLGSLFDFKNRGGREDFCNFCNLYQFVLIRHGVANGEVSAKALYKGCMRRDEDPRGPHERNMWDRAARFLIISVTKWKTCFRSFYRLQQKEQIKRGWKPMSLNPPFHYQKANPKGISVFTSQAEEFKLKRVRANCDLMKHFLCIGTVERPCFSATIFWLL